MAQVDHTGSPYAMKQWPVWVGIAFVWLAGRLPYRLLMTLAQALGLIVVPLLKARGRIAKRNLELCFPALSNRDRHALWQSNLRNSTYLLAEFAFAWCASNASSAKLEVKVKNPELLAAARARGNGVLLVGAHFSHLDLCGRLLCEYLRDGSVGGMYRPHETLAMEHFVRSRRLKYAGAMFKRDELRGAIRWLKSGKILWYAPDQDYKRGDTVFAPFFGIVASTLTATHQLARMTGAAVIGFAHRRTERGYEIEFLGPLDNFPSGDPVNDTTRVNAMLEQAIRRAPEQYLWMHQRFKSRPEGEVSRY